jgi:hypothetical protein
MSYRKTKLIQERNILLEQKHILEQAPPPPPPAPVTPPPPPPASPTTPPVGGTPSTSGTTGTDKKISEEQIKKAQPCSDVPNKIDETKNEKKTRTFKMILSDEFGSIPVLTFNDKIDLNKRNCKL